MNEVGSSTSLLGAVVGMSRADEAAADQGTWPRRWVEGFSLRFDDFVDWCRIISSNVSSKITKRGELREEYLYG